MTSERYIGLMSGTSLDGVDAALIEISETGSLTTLATHYQPFCEGLQSNLSHLARAEQWPVDLFARTELNLTQQYATCVLHMLESANISSSSIRAIGAHGQTIRHLPELGFSYQLINPSLLAAETGIDVIADFRRADLARGGQGAPLLPSFHAELCRATDQARCLLNIGGIANLTSLSPDGTTVGFDTGPGNTLINAWCRLKFEKDYDDKGAIARQGKVQASLLRILLQDAYFLRPPPKSTGPERFNLTWLDEHLLRFGESVSDLDMLCTLVELTAKTSADAIDTHSQAKDVLIFGGGIHNDYLLERLQAHLPSRRIGSTERLGIDPDFMEATAFGWLAHRLLHDQPGNLIAVTGASSPALLGGWYPSGRSLS